VAAVYTEINNILNAVLPDNANFTATDAANWEMALGLISNNSLYLETRKTAILRKIQHPGTIKARQHALYLENQLQLAGFDVYVYENRTFIDFVACICGLINVGQTTVGNPGLGIGNFETVANYFQNENYNLGTTENLQFTFFIMGATYGTRATVQDIRENEFKELILKLKPAQTVAILYIDYIDFSQYILDTYDNFILDTYNNKIWAN